ncbi:hypothetical protein TWF730_006844 [Orbilia blumenaviensis]|uniref:Amidase domain-containing protein n=1 Tax=Orbilia blumenaviensis TaxID=1796055 RepID=A0AAV9VFH2_9PEZI
MLQPFVTAITMGASIASTIEYGDIKYLVSEKVVGIIDSTSAVYNSNFNSSLDGFDNGDIRACSGVDAAIPITIVNLDLSEKTTNISSRWLNDTISSMLATDDVFGRFFLETVIFGVPRGKIQHLSTIFEDGLQVLQGFGVKDHSFLGLDDPIPSGPYFLKSGRVYQAMRLYPDLYEAFMYGVIQSEDGFVRPQTNLIPVPSRLYSHPSLPLSGKRIAVKDIINLQNLPTSASSKAYAQYSGPSTSTAKAIEHLISLGAIIVGKTRTTQFANGETARDWIDFQCPFNPRADGYLDPAGSSTGSAVAVAGYEWVDFAVGTDSCGSIIWPAALQGVFGLRPTFGVSDLEGVLPYSSVMDTMGFFARDIQNFQLLQKIWYRKIQKKQGPSRIIVPKGVFDPLPSSKKLVMTKFIEDIRNSAELPRVELDIDKLWRASGLSPKNTAYMDYLNSTVAHIQIHDSYIHETRFYNRYKQKFGRYPYINPMVLHKWEIKRQNISTADYEEALRRMKVFKEFLESQVFNDGAVMMLPAGGAEAMYRDELIAPENIDVYLQSFGFDNTFYSILGGLPSVVIPVGQRPITSRVTKEIVWEPVSMMIVGQAGSESQIIDLIRKVLVSSGRPMGVKAGDKAF